MGLLGVISFSLALVSLTQISSCSAKGCKITSATASGPSSIRVKWKPCEDATNYFLDLRVKNNTNFAPVVVTLSARTTEWNVNGLRAGSDYSVTLKVFEFYYVVCVDTVEATTVPAKSQIVDGRALSSTSIMVEWTEVPSAEYYYLQVISQTTGEVFNQTYKNSSAVVGNLQSSSNYDIYIFTVNHAGMGGSSKVRTVTTLVMPPVGVQATQTGLGMARVTWQPVEDVLLYSVIVRDVDDPGSRPKVYNVSDTRLDVQGILPCSTYLISVSSFNKFLIPSEPTDHTYTTNKLTPVSSVSVDYTCTTDSVMVEWTGVFGADSYEAMAVSENGTKRMCTSPGTNCRISGLICSQSYVVHVVPISESCTNTLNTTTVTFQTVPCPPKQLELLRECSSEVIVFSWEHTNNTDHYMARAVDSQGVVQDCLTEDNSCYFTHTVCGRHYYFSVYSITGQCNSQMSSTVDIRTAPCIPQNLQTSADCSSDVLLSKWDLAEGALSYTVEAFGNRGTNSHYNCSSRSNSCAIEGLHCGEFLTVYITAYDDECASPRTLGPVAETVPCAPRNVSAVRECGADSITMTWIGGSAIFYVAIAVDIDGVIHSCNALDTMCQIVGLKCSTNYTAYVLASNFMCNSTGSEMVTIETAACPPNHIEASLDCAANQALISWLGQPEMNSYTAIIEDEIQGLLSCSSTNTSCWIPNLKCGQLYTVTVSHHDGICPSMPSMPIYMDSVPCGPEVTAGLDCRSGELNLSWESSSNAEGYLIFIQNSDKNMTFDTREPSLTFDMLECGKDYTIKVMSYNSSCVSHPSVLHVGKIPCVPTNVVARRTCGQSSVKVTWQASLGADSYQAAAVSRDGQRLLCPSNGTSCMLEGLMCGKVYSIHVSALNNLCASNESAPQTLQTAPCPPSQFNASINCANNSAMLTWNSSPNAVSYTGRAVSTDGHTVICDAQMNLSCHLHNLQCGKEYIFTVSASDGDCESPDSEPVILTTAPCAVQDVVTTLNCSTNTLTITWTPGSMPANYSVTALAADGTVLRNMTEGSICVLSDLKCGQQYNVTVRAVSKTCDGHSVSEVVNSVPCIPESVRGEVECSTNTLQASWDTTPGAASYITTLKGAGGFSSSCPSKNESCLFSSLKCAQMYTFTVMAVNDRCNSSESSTISAMTAPCDPTNVSATLNCSSGVATVTWGRSAGAINYTVVAEADGHMDSCHSPHGSCELTQLQCGEDYTVTVLAGDGKCNSSILAKTNITTAPCPPVILDYSLDCVSNNVSVTWISDKDAMNVTVHAISNLGYRSSCSSSTTNSCDMDDLMCGHTYTMHAVAQGVQCLSKPSATFEVVTAPCTPKNVEYTYSCETGITLLSWDETLGRETFYARIYSEDYMIPCPSGTTFCPPMSLPCGRMFYVEVTAVAGHCNSSVPGVTQIKTAPCPPMNLSASLVCENNTALVSWDQSASAVSYKVVATARDGDVKNCMTPNTSCYIPNMHCAETYVIMVTPYSDSCEGYHSYPYNYIAGPCPPTNVHVSLQCEGNIGHVTWDPALQADLYVVTAVPSAPDDHNHTCSSGGKNCSLTDLHCGETAVVTVVTTERGCTSEPSLPFTFQSVICPPTRVTGVTNCSNNDITVSWDPSPESGVEYFIRSQREGWTAANFSTSSTSHVVTGLQCGELYTLSVAVTDSECTSNFSVPIETETAPCPPTNLTARAECGTNLGNLTWAPVTHAISYTATLTGDHGHVVFCPSNTTTCAEKLDCGHRYTASMIASSATCNSSRGESLSFDSAPCLPDDVVAELDCVANTFAVQWRASVVDSGTYTALAIGSDESRLSCDAPTTNCTIQELKCGLNYSIVVTTSSVDCGIIEGSDYTMMSAPCKPVGVSVNLQCSTNMAFVTWSNSGPDQTQLVSAVDSRGRVTVCNSTSSNCTFEKLKCGETYTVGVVGLTDTCSSEITFAEAQVKTAPCVPKHPTARVDCVTGITSVTWDTAPGATNYAVYAQGDLGHYDECNNTDTNCYFRRLPCGQNYSITVVARHESCISLVSETIYVMTGPCPHSGLQTYLDCDTNTAVVSWTPGSGILYYNASADAFDIVDLKGCSSNGSSCNISSLRCGESYRVSVSGQGENCPSPARDWYRVNTAPCPPTQLTVDSSCHSNDIVVSWQASKGSFSYMAVAENKEGRQWACTNSTTTCKIFNLPCGQRFEVHAVGVDNECTGAKSNMEVIHTAPCEPQNIQSDLDCLSGVLNVTWESTGHFVQLCASVVSSSGDASIWKTADHHRVIPGMQCGQTYNVTVWAEDEACNSSYSPTKQVVTAPCPLSTFLPEVDCASGNVSVSWSNSSPGVMYTVFAVDSTGRQHNCSSKGTGCGFSRLKCGMKYSITITPSRDGCVGRDSPTQTIMTVPCVPQLSDSEMDCLTNSAWLMYEESEGAEDYVVTATDSQGNVQTYEFNSTSDRTLALPPLMCSKNITFTLQARDQQCSSAPSNAITTETAPCPPENVNMSVGCANHSVTAAWSAVPGALSYTATLEQINGGSACCTSPAPGSSCDVTHLPCGEMYILLVVAEGRTCNSSQSEGEIVRTVPCVPENLKANLSCKHNVASMSWNHSRGAQFYTVKAVGEDGHEVNCSDHENMCDLKGLHCGQYYTATVTAEDIHCQSKTSESVEIKTAPCTPAYITSEMDCEDNTLVVSWVDSPGADSYIATMRDSNGQATSCLGTTEGSCNVTGVGCGQVYHVSVVSSDGCCDSPPTPEVETPSVPCKASNIEATMDCYKQTAMVSWYPSDGAWTYEVTAITASGHNVSWEGNSTFVDLGGLLCGEGYTLCVKAVGETCSSDAYMAGELITEPCIPERINTLYSTTVGQVLWDAAAGADDYTVKGVTDRGLMVSCMANDTYCALYDMTCGQTYNISVTANNHVCSGLSTSTEDVVIMTEPCPPTNVQTSVRCQTDMGAVSWEASDSAIAYEALLSGRDSHEMSCYSNDTYCEVDGLHCGVVYYTSVIAIGETLNSSSSTPVLLVAAPCTPEIVTASLDCYNNTARVSWSETAGADSYAVTAMAMDGTSDSCETDGLWCNLTKLVCGQTYNISLISIGEDCRTEKKTEVTFSTRPCKPERVGVDLVCGTSTADLHWEESDGVELYMATAYSSTGIMKQCNSTNSTCYFSELQCGETYEFTVAAYVDMCCSEISSAVEIKTEPCQPSGLTLSGSCYNETVVLDWFEADGASAYRVMVTGDLGYVTAFQTEETILEADLPCGQLYTFTVQAQDGRCESPQSRPADFKTGPCIPKHVESFTPCENNTGSVSWGKSDGAEFYMAIAVGQDGHTHMCTSNTTICSWDDLHCGEQYTVHVVANDDLCSSMPSNSTSIHMAPCIPQNVDSSLNCTYKFGSVSWDPSETAEYYVVTAETNGGHRVQLSTNDTWTFISEFQCGQKYFLSVQAADSECTSLPSQPSVLQSVPCPPTDVSSSMNCLSNIAVVSWTGSAGAVFYTATVTQGDGYNMSCWTDTEECGMQNLNCGQDYTVEVIASNNECDSDPAEGDSLESGPCVPTDVEIKVNCSANEAEVSWSASEGAVSYRVSAKSRQGDVSICESPTPIGILTNLTCGQTYSVQVVAEDEICSSLPSQALEFESVPCTPTNASIVLDCYTNSALLDWAYAEGAVNYTATARSSSGNVSICSSNYTNCELLKLQCGETYEVTTVASNGMCSSPPSSTLQVKSVPCPPEDVTYIMDCSTNTAWVGWEPSIGADSYIVQALGLEEHETGCEAESSESCILTDLLCGFTYNISVIAVNSICNVTQSEVTQLHAVPCVPQQVESRVVCESGAVAVSWEPSKGATSYTTVALGNGGYTSSYNTTGTTYLFTDLLCGHNYTITVSASDEACSSAESYPEEINTAPCVPQRVTAEMMCSADTGVVTWEEDEVVSSYTVRAYGPDGHRTKCNGTGTYCQLLNMHCGQLYNLTVTAEDGVCDNSNAYLSLQSVPCKPTNVKAALLCHSNSAAVTWERASGALSYLAVGVTADGSHQTECNHTETHCDMTDLQCGQTYNVTVFAEDQYCSSMESEVSYMQTAPCPPESVAVNALCDDGDMTISWLPNPDAQHFYATAVSNTGARLHCNSSGTACTIFNLPCGQTYNITVVSKRDECESEPSAVVKTSSAPCVPSKPEGRLDCVSNSAWVTWEASEGADSYYVVAEGVGGHTSNCTSKFSPCNVPDLQCGTLYTFYVTAVNKHCNSSNSTTFELETGPCALTSVSAVTQCNNDTILVEWERTEDTPVYVVTAEGHDLSIISCNSSWNSCVLKKAKCGMHYSIIVSTSSDKCSSLRSPPKKIKTAPCAPENVTMTPSCEDHGASVTWGHSHVATSYLLISTGADGHVVHCNTSMNNCTLANLHCGQTYSLNITATGDNCTSPATTATFRSVPCEPSGLAVDVDCETNSAVLSWDASEGAVEYYGCAQPFEGDPIYCDSDFTSCVIEGLECGEVYNFSVEASDGFCNSSLSEPLQEGAAPCPPSTPKVRLQRIGQIHWAMASWEHIDCPDVEYLVEITGRIEDSPQAVMEVSSYWLPRPYFEFPMPCSTAYNLTVRSRNSGGVSEQSIAFIGVTVPCAPKNVQYSGTRESVRVSWESSVFATGYTIYDESGAERVELCSTEELFCQLIDFDPDNTTVIAYNDEGESNPSLEITGSLSLRRRRDLRTTEVFSHFDNGLEVPKLQNVTVSGVSLYVKWTTVKDANEYTLLIEEEQNKQQRVRTVEGDFYTETNLKPWTTYSVRIRAKNTITQSHYTRPVSRTTGSR
ncbi:uncharacterized protein LOC117806306 [Xyrichtys novacula]|uniref:Uncharacterized protein LOC117806306 n=1 Tax=Xyrichtys novacula TaxID=13765 RepID=A0AAV1FLE3_XYRNO|nr:uncharacterized protein LOC117806306 [Xyrichtys novacula]